MFSVVPETDDGLWNELFAMVQQSEEGNISGSSSGNQSQVPTYGRGSGSTLNPIGTSDSPRAEQLMPRAGETASGSTKGKRYRDADKVKELEALAAAKMEQFTALVQCNAELRFKSKILSEAVMLRDYHLIIGRSLAQGQVPPPPVSLPAGKLGDPSGGFWQLQAAQTSISQAVRTPGSQQLLVDPSLLPPLDSNSVRAFSPSQLLARWKAFVAEASSLLLVLENNPNNEQAALRMRDLCAETGCHCRYTTVLAPDTMRTFMQTHLESGSLEAPELGHWQRVLQAMQLTEEQLIDLRAVYQLFDTMMRGVLAERRTLQAKLSSSLQQAAQQHAGAVAQLTIPPESEVLPALERNMRKEESAHALLRGFMFGHKLSILQFCRAAVQSYPFFPNATRLVALAAGVTA